MKITATLMITLILMIASVSNAKAAGHDKKATTEVVKHNADNSATPAVAPANDEQSMHHGNPSNGPVDVVKYGSIIQDGKVVIIRNKPVILYA